VRQGKYKAAIQEYNDILKADPQDTTTLNLLGDLYVRVEAIPDAVRTFIRVADLYCHTGRATKAIAVLKKAAKLDSHNLECATKLARLFAQEDLLVEAQQQCVIVAECYLHAGLREQGYGVYRELIQRSPDNVEFRLRLAESCLRDEQRDEAYEAFHDAAQTLQRQGRHEESLRTYLKALTAKPDGRGALNAAVNIYLQRGETQPAEALIRHLLRVRPDDPEMLTLLGHVQQMELALAEARKAISHAVEEDPKALQYQVDLVSAGDRAYLTFMMAVAELQRQGRERDALNTCLKALKLKPGDKPALFIAVNLYLKLGDMQSAVVMLRHSLRAHPDNVELLLMLGSVYQQAHDASGAEQVMSRAFALQPSCWREVLEFAGYCGRMGEHERALRLIDRVMECCDEVHHQHAIIEVLHILLNWSRTNSGTGGCSETSARRTKRSGIWPSHSQRSLLRYERLITGLGRMESLRPRLRLGRWRCRGRIMNSPTATRRLTRR
jgi:tetratricopeptide (TPR) repeat protein